MLLICHLYHLWCGVCPIIYLVLTQLFIVLLLIHIFYFNFYPFVYECACACVCVCVHMCEGAQKGQKRASDPLELELQVIVSLPI